MLIEASGIHKRYHDGKKEFAVLRGVSLAIREAEFIGIVGQSGAGKSTLLHILGGLDSPSQGEVLFEKHSLYCLNDETLSRTRNENIGFVFQFYHLLPEFTVLENVLMPGFISLKRTANSSKLRVKAIHLLETVGLSERVDYFPAQLSGGEKQRVALVRGLMNDPRILLCDEPTGNLDSQSGGEIIQLLKKINIENKMAVVLVTHNFELAKRTDKIYHLKDGVLILSS